MHTKIVSEQMQSVKYLEDIFLTLQQYNAMQTFIIFYT